MKKATGVLLLIAAMSYFSCSKDSSDPENNPSGNCRMIRMVNSLGVFDLSYDQNNMITSLRTVTPEGDSSWENYYYENGHVVYMIRIYRGTAGDTIRYTYESGIYTQCESYGTTLKYFYDGSGNIIKMEEWKNQAMEDYSEYVYDGNGNCVSFSMMTKTDSGYSVYQQGTLEFGTKKNMYISIGIPPLNSAGETIALTRSRNNMTKVSISYMNYPISYAINYSYSNFNEQGFPLDFTLSASDSTILDSGTIQYACP